MQLDAVSDSATLQEYKFLCPYDLDSDLFYNLHYWNAGIMPFMLQPPWFP